MKERKKGRLTVVVVVNDVREKVRVTQDDPRDADRPVGLE